jgi:hypothetical protein
LTQAGHFSKAQPQHHSGRKKPLVEV